ncbi:hypothetical protein CE91St36_08750 [Christensenellaceae bacterium]|nr:hypothetical protein CE91St36_08750 [Christensenellaceae bacterium]BDF60726.1 hypothetical protein CE91St37_08760 [Christensenellaceae bacterium]
MELLLFYAIPRRDTNALAHILLEKFGSLERLFQADIKDIACIDGVGEQSALLIKLVFDLARRSAQTSPVAPKLKSIDSAIRYAQDLLTDKTEEQFYVICLDAHFSVIHTELLSRGTATETPVYIRHITESVVRSGADKVIIAHNHPGGSAQPSKNDVETTQRILKAMDALEIGFLDHVIVGKADAFSIAEKLLLRSDYPEKDARFAQYSARVMQDLPSLFQR